MNESLQPFEIQREALAERLNLREQWESQIKILNETGILQLLPESQELGIVGIDGKEYPVPDYQEIMSRITPEKAEMLETKTGQGFNKMLVVPFGAPIIELINAYGSLLRKKDSDGTLFGSDGSKLELNKESPVFIGKMISGGSDLKKEIFYYPKGFGENHNGLTKNGILQQDQEAFKIEFVQDITELPMEDDYNTINKNTLNPADHLEGLRQDQARIDECGFTPETWLTLAASTLIEKNQQIDNRHGAGEGSYLLGAYFYNGQGDGAVPYVSWHFDDRDSWGGEDHQLRFLPQRQRNSVSGVAYRTSVEI